MTTDLERLKAWMQANEISAAKLGRLLKISASSLSTMLNDKRPISAGMKVSFWGRYGHDAAMGIFQDEHRVHPAHHNSEKFTKPDKYAAHQALALAVKRGHLPPAKNFKCHGCDKQAVEYHHESYAPEDHLCVVPLCRGCHINHHNGRKPLTFGVVPTSVGLIRVAIAPSPEAQL